MEVLLGLAILLSLSGPLLGLALGWWRCGVSILAAPDWQKRTRRAYLRKSWPLPALFYGTLLMAMILLDRISKSPPDEALACGACASLIWLCAGPLIGVHLYVSGMNGVEDPDLRACMHCGYDLTGNTSGRCPECGEPTG